MKKDLKKYSSVILYFIPVIALEVLLLFIYREFPDTNSLNSDLGIGAGFLLIMQFMIFLIFSILNIALFFDSRIMSKGNSSKLLKISLILILPIVLSFYLVVRSTLILINMDLYYFLRQSELDFVRDYIVVFLQVILGFAVFVVREGVKKSEKI